MSSNIVPGQQIWSTRYNAWYTYVGTYSGGQVLARRKSTGAEYVLKLTEVLASQPVNSVTLESELKAKELDPTGRGQHEKGAKLDAGKNRLGLVLGSFANALSAVGSVGTYGANKYTDNGWLSVPNGVERYTDAMLRHVFSDLGGEKRDPDTELLHAAHACWNSLARLELMLRADKDAADAS